MKALVLIDGLHTGEVLDALSGVVPLDRADLMLAYVRRADHGPLELARRRPAARPIPPHRERDLRQAEEAAGADAVAEAKELAGGHARSVETFELTGDPGPAVCELAAARGADVVVVRTGGRDRPPFGPAVLGPTARFIAGHCVRPVLLLRA